MRRLTWESFRYLPVSRSDRQWGLYVTGAGRVVDATPDYDYSGHPPPYYTKWDDGRVLPEYAVVYVIRGQGEYESETFARQTVAAGSVMLVFPGVWHRYRPHQETPWTEYWVTFGGSYLKGLVRRGLISAAKPILQTGLDEAVFHGFHCLLDRVRSEPPALQQLIAANALEILGAVVAAAQAREEGTAPTCRNGPEGASHKSDHSSSLRRQLSALVERAELVLQQRIEQPVDMEQLAASLGLSYERFRHVFKQQTGLAPYQYHLQLRIERAKELLHQTPLSVRQVAAALRFADAAHFAHVFKKKVGTWPSRWQEMEASAASAGRVFSTDRSR
jgi:AraC-like DNA-binding protein